MIFKTRIVFSSGKFVAWSEDIGRSDEWSSYWCWSWCWEGRSFRSVWLKHDF